MANAYEASTNFHKRGRMVKVCQGCKVEQPLTEFYREGPTKRKPLCRACYRARRNGWSKAGTQPPEGKTEREKKRLARLRVEMRVYRGTLVRPESCETCGAACKPQAHHDDHDKPLEVRWLCPPCHRAADKQLREQAAA